MRKVLNHPTSYFMLLTGFLFSISSYAQENPPIPVEVEVSTSQYLNFGAFVVGDGGGTLSVDDQGIRTPGPGVTLLSTGQPVSAALFDVYANPGTLINITHNASFELLGTSGQTITLKIDSYSTGKSFITTQSADVPNPVFIGGTLYLDDISANGAGKYNGTFNITFIQE